MAVRVVADVNRFRWRPGKSAAHKHAIGLGCPIPAFRAVVGIIRLESYPGLILFRRHCRKLSPVGTYWSWSSAIQISQPAHGVAHTQENKYPPGVRYSFCSLFD